MTAAVKARASRQERRRRALIGLGAVVLVVLCWFLVGEMIFAWQAARCPAAAFYADSPAALHVFTVAPLVIAATASALLAAGGISGKGWPRLRMPAPGAPAAPLSRSARRLRRHGIILAGLTVAALPLSIGFSFSQFCLAPEGIAYRPAPWEGFRDYAWSDVTAIRAACWSGRRGWLAEYVLGLSDGSSIDIMGSATAAKTAVPQILRALHGHALAFDAHGVSRHCGYPNAALLRERP
jgi:hypothetical protein